MAKSKTKRKSNQAKGWSTIPGVHLPVDIAPTKIADDTNDISKWTSPHYNNEDDDNSVASRDLYDPLENSRGKEDGAGEFGMFYSLEVISGDSYRVEKSGDETSGFVTNVVFTDKTEETENVGQNQESSKQTSKKNCKKSDPVSNAADTSDKPLNKRQRQQLKRKARMEAEAAEKHQKKESDQSSSDGTSKNQEPKLPQHKLKSEAKGNLKATKPKQKSTEDSSKPNESNPATEANNASETKLTKKQRQKLKRKARLEAEATENQKKRKLDTQPPSSSTNPDTQHNSTSQQKETPNQSDLISLQTAWTTPLHSTLLSSLHSLNYTYPTPIQSATLSAAILGRRDIVGAAPTGSGKTLSYGLPILQFLLENCGGEGGDCNEDGEDKGLKESLPLQALVLVPTRELAIQVTNELKRVSSNQISIGTIVGGFAEVKQRRVLEKNRPPVIVCTPGRLWELMSSNEYSHLNEFSQLRFLVIDEADRMIKQGSFPQLKQIFEVINQANPPPANEDQDEESDDGDEERLRSLKGVRGEAKVVMLDDSILAAIERERTGSAKPKPMEMDDDEYLEQEQELMNGDYGSEDDDSEEDGGEEQVHRQTFVYSATLTLPPSSHHNIKKKASVGKSIKKKGKKKQPTTVDGAIAEILEFAGARGELKIVDLSNLVPEGKNQQAKKSKAAAGEEQLPKPGSSSDEPSPMAARLPPGLSLGEIRCAQRHKDGHLYAYLVTTQQGSSGPCLVFCNSIAAVRRVGETLKILGLPVKMLHAQMAQKSRMNSLEFLRTPKCRSIVVSSDVASRGLDIPSVATVVHYDVARSIDTFIHRSGRTARGVGDNAVGVSISLVAPAEEREHRRICEAVRGVGQGSLDTTSIDGRLLSEAQARVALANKIVKCDDAESQASKKNKWLQDTAREAGLEVDEDMLESSLMDGDQRDRQRFIESKQAKAELRLLLQKPMRCQHFGKYLSQPGLQDAIRTEAKVKPFVVKETVSKRKKRKKTATRLQS